MPLNCPLANVLSVVPDVMDKLPPDSWSALSGCNKELQQLIHSRTKTVFIDHADDITSMINTEWPKLSLIILCYPNTLKQYSWPSEAKIQLLLGVRLLTAPTTPGSNSLHATALVVSSKSQHGPQQVAPADDGGDMPLARYLQSPQWHGLQQLYALNNSFGARGIAQLTGIEHQLAKLDLSSTNVTMSARDMQELVNGTWVSLIYLDLSQSRLTYSTIAPLADSYWPALQVCPTSHTLPMKPAQQCWCYL